MRLAGSEKVYHPSSIEFQEHPTVLQATNLDWSSVTGLALTTRSLLGVVSCPCQSNWAKANVIAAGLHLTCSLYAWVLWNFSLRSKFVGIWSGIEDESNGNFWPCLGGWAASYHLGTKRKRKLLYSMARFQFFCGPEAQICSCQLLQHGFRSSFICQACPLRVRSLFYNFSANMRFLVLIFAIVIPTIAKVHDGDLLIVFP